MNQVSSESLGLYGREHWVKMRQMNTKIDTSTGDVRGMKKESHPNLLVGDYLFSKELLEEGRKKFEKIMVSHGSK